MYCFNTKLEFANPNPNPEYPKFAWFAIYLQFALKVRFLQITIYQFASSRIAVR